MLGAPLQGRCGSHPEFTHAHNALIAYEQRPVSSKVSVVLLFQFVEQWRHILPLAVIDISPTLLYGFFAVRLTRGQSVVPVNFNGIQSGACRKIKADTGADGPSAVSATEHIFNFDCLWALEFECPVGGINDVATHVAD